jgi:hypothetical protein
MPAAMTTSLRWRILVGYGITLLLMVLVVVWAVATIVSLEFFVILAALAKSARDAWTMAPFRG